MHINNENADYYLNKLIMKKLFILSFISLLIFSCSKSPEEKAKKLINDDLFKTLHDYDSYQAVEFSKLDSTFTDASSTEEYKELSKEYNEKMASLKKIQESLKFDLDWTERMGGFRSVSEAKKMKLDVDKMNAIYEETKVIQLTLDSIDENFVPEFIGYSMTHKYRAKSKVGNMSLGIEKYTFNKDISEIINNETLVDW